MSSVAPFASISCNRLGLSARMSKSLEAEIKVRLDADTKDRLEAIAERQGAGIKLSHVVRQAIERYLKEDLRLQETPDIRPAEWYPKSQSQTKGHPPAGPVRTSAPSGSSTPKPAAKSGPTPRSAGSRRAVKAMVDREKRDSH